MLSNDILSLLTWWLMLFVVTLANYPLTSLLFRRFVDRGYIFAKIFGVLLLSYIIFVLGILHIAPFTYTTTLCVLAFIALINLIAFYIFNRQRVTSKRADIKKFIFIEELLFFGVLFFWSYVRAHQPAIEGLEKFMDYGFVKSILNSRYFPPQDMWLASSASKLSGENYINYYYFGHLVTAVLTRLSLLPAAVTYNLQIATLSALTFAGSFSLGINLFTLNLEPRTSNVTKKILIAGLLTAFLVTFSGNLHTLYAFTTGYETGDNQTPPLPWNLPLDTKLTDYWYPNATRFIPYTIHEFPSYSAIVADLHGHYSNIPHVLLILAVLLVLIRSTNSKHQAPNIKQTPKTKHQILNRTKNWNLFGTWDLRFGYLLLIGFLLAVFYMTNSWDTLIYGLLTFGVLVVKETLNALMSLRSLKRLAGSLLIVALTFLLFSLPFTSFFHPFSSKIGINCGYEITSLLKDSLLTSAGNGAEQAIEFGPFIAEAGKCQHTPIWMHFILWGFFYFIIAGFVLFILRPKLKQLSPTHLFLSLLILVSLFLLWLPEFAYIADIYPAHFRANTMFKLGYQAFIMLSLVSGYTIVRIVAARPWRASAIIYTALLLPQLFLISIYPLFGINSYYNGLTQYHSLYGLNWMRDRYPDDYRAAVWLDSNAKELCSGDYQSPSSKTVNNRHYSTEQPRTSNLEPRTVGKPKCPVVLEAVGDSYTQYARVSANTGLPTIVGWPVHEWLWRGSYDEAGKRRGEVETIYTSQDAQEVKRLLEKYNVTLIFVGSLEREQYEELTEDVFNNLGTVVFESGRTRIYQLPGRGR